MGVKMQMTLPFDRETVGTVVYAVKKIKTVPVGQVYINKDKLAEAGHTGEWPGEVVVTVETR